MPAETTPGRITCGAYYELPAQNATVRLNPFCGPSDCPGHEHAKVYRGRKCSDPPHEVAVVEPWSGSQDALKIVKYRYWRASLPVQCDWGENSEHWRATNLALSILRDATDVEGDDYLLEIATDVIEALPDAFELSQREVLEWVDEWEKRDKEPHNRGVTEASRPLVDLRGERLTKKLADTAVAAYAQNAGKSSLDLEQETPAERTVKGLGRAATLGVSAAEALKGSPDERADTEEARKGDPAEASHDSGVPNLNAEQSFRDWLQFRKETLPITSKTAFVLGVTAGAIVRTMKRVIDQPGVVGDSAPAAPIRACHVKASCFDGDGKNALCRKAQEFLAWYYGTGPSEMPEWLEWEGEDG
ncbi:MAG: hypothetical protein V3W37_03070 [Candidatus Binatia bacterium]